MSLPPRTPENVTAACARANLTQREACELMELGQVTTLSRAQRGWRGKKLGRAAWKLLLLLTNQHPEYEVVRREKPLDLSWLPHPPGSVPDEADD